MTTLEYLKKKNEIVFGVTDEILIPEDQLMEVPYHKNFKPSRLLASCNCPYCLASNSCAECPMGKAGNECITDDDNSYGRVAVIWGETATDSDEQKLYDLGVEYQKNNKQ